ncbi:hypothetical protein G6F33_003810 [Rhizopus arrhizus]|nr:hypothetical protein G6F24_001206 [Rhizopus arrhizus]KAG0914921.1 hypothetical protein G6F33_003810 [Rhizopus arrhizus]
MAISSDSWLDCLVKHPIFEISELDKQRVESSKTKQNVISNNITDFVLQRHICVLTMRDNDLFVAVGSTIRVLNLTEFKDAWTTASKNNIQLSNNWVSSIPYKILDTPEINFNIESLTPNLNGRLLSVNGQHSLVIVCLPRQGFGDVSMFKKSIDCRTLTIGRKYYGSDKGQLLQVKWHPLSETRTHLVALSSDNTLRMFDISTDIDDPEQSFDLFQNNNASETAVTFSIGGTSHDQNGWEPFTIYYALRNGQIYMLCPVIPFKSAIRKGHLDNLMNLVDAKYQKEKVSDSNDINALTYLYKLQKQWLQDLFDSAKVGCKANPSLMNNDTLSVVSNTSSFNFPVKIQGPFLTNCPTNSRGYAQVTDILYVYSEPLHILILALSNGLIQNHMLNTESDAQWDVLKADGVERWQHELHDLLKNRYLPTAILYEEANVKTKSSPSVQSIRLVHDSLYKDTYYAYHSGGVTAVNMNKWLDAFKNAFQKVKDGKKDALAGLKSCLDKKTPSDIRHLINTVPFYGAFTPVVGLFVMTDIYLSYTLIAMTFDYKLSFRHLNIRHESEQDKDREAAIKNQLKYIVKETEYEPLLPLPPFEKPKQPDNLPSQSKIIIPSELSDAKELVINEETLRFFSESAEQIRYATRELNKAAMKSKERLCLQQKEFENQVSTICDLYNRYQRFFSTEAKKAREQELQEITQRHAKLRLRMDKQLRLVLNNCQPDLANEENEWTEKLKEFSDKLTGSSGYASRVELLQNQLEQLKIQSGKDRKFNPTNMSASQLQNTLSILKSQSESINEAKKRIENMENKVLTTAS